MGTYTKKGPFTDKSVAPGPPYTDAAFFNDLEAALFGAHSEINGLDTRVDVLESGTAAAALLDKIKTVDGAGSLLDADLLDGIELAALQLRSEKNVAGGYAGLDPTTGKLLTNLIPDTVLGAVDYQGAWNANTNTPALDATGTGRSKGDYYVVSVGGTTNLAGKTDWEPKDWIVWNGVAWEFVDNSDSVTAVFGRLGAVAAQAGDYTAAQITNTPAGSIEGVTLQAAVNELDTEKQAVSAKNAANGYLGLNASSLAPAQYLGSGTRDGTKYLRDDNTWQPVSAGSQTAYFGQSLTPAATSTLTGSANNTYVKVPFNLADLDPHSWLSTTNSRFTPNRAGYYEVNAAVTFTGTITGSIYRIALYKNGALDKVLDSDHTSHTGAASPAGGPVVIYMNGTTDFLEIYGSTSATSAPNVTANSYFRITWIGL